MTDNERDTLRLRRVEIAIGEMPAKPCPFCGSSLLLIRIEDGGGGGRVCCDECQTEGPYATVDMLDNDHLDEPGNNIVLAVLKIWNTRLRPTKRSPPGPDSGVAT